MALFTESAIRQRARAEIQRTPYKYSAESIILDSVKTFSAAKTYDIFLSHSIRDAELILGMKATLEDMGYSVYVDWIEDPQLDRSKVTPTTADKLRTRMNSSNSLFYVTTNNSTASKWMPWECGYFDGKKEKAAIVPIANSPTGNSYYGQEYLGLYPFVVKDQSRGGKELLYIHKSTTIYTTYDNWVKTPNAKIQWMES